MKKPIALTLAFTFILSLTTYAIDTCRTTILRKVIRDVSPYSSFINLKVVDNSGIHNIVVNNGMFYTYLKNKYGYDLQTYIDILVEKIQANEPVTVGNDIAPIKYIIQIKSNNIADSIFKTGGIEAIKEYYFKGYKVVDDDKDVFEAVPYLFKNNYKMHQSDYGGGIELRLITCKESF